LSGDVGGGVDFADEEGCEAFGGVEEHFDGEADDIVAASAEILCANSKRAWMDTESEEMAG
jgi:hypothetical protein